MADKETGLVNISYWPCCINQSNSSIYILALWKPYWPCFFRIDLVFSNYCFPILDTGQAKFTI